MLSKKVVRHHRQWHHKHHNQLASQAAILMKIDITSYGSSQACHMQQKGMNLGEPDIEPGRRQTEPGKTDRVGEDSR